MIRVLLVEIRRSPGFIAFPLLAAAHVLIIWQDASFWVGDWHATSIQVQSGNILLATFIATCAAWAAGRERRHGHLLLAKTMPRPQAEAVAVQWAAVTSWGLLAYGVGLGFAAYKTVPVAVAGGPWPSYLVLGGAAVCAYSAIGYIIGSFNRWRILAPLAGVAVYAYFVIVGLHGGSMSRLDLLYTDTLISPQFRPRTMVLGIQLLWAAAVVVVALAVTGTRRTTLGTRAPLLILAAVPAVGAFLTATSLGGGDLAQRPAPEREFCQGRAPRVCVWPEHAKWADDTAEVAHGMATALDGVYSFPPTVYEEGLPEAPSSGEPVVQVNTIPTTRPSLVTGLMIGLLPEIPPGCPTQSSERLENYVVIVAWLQIRGAGELGRNVLVDENKLQALLDRSPSEQKAWVRKNLRAVNDCSAPVPPPSSLQSSQRLT